MSFLLHNRRLQFWLSSSSEQHTIHGTENCWTWHSQIMMKWQILNKLWFFFQFYLHLRSLCIGENMLDHLDKLYRHDQTNFWIKENRFCQPNIKSVTWICISSVTLNPVSRFSCQFCSGFFLFESHGTSALLMQLTFSLFIHLTK